MDSLTTIAARLNDAGIPTPNWLADPRVARIARRAVRAAYTARRETLHRSGTYVWVSEYRGISIMALDAIRREVNERHDELCWGAGTKWPRATLTLSAEWLARCPTGSDLVAWLSADPTVYALCEYSRDDDYWLPGTAFARDERIAA